MIGHRMTRPGPFVPFSRPRRKCNAPLVFGDHPQRSDQDEHDDQHDNRKDDPDDHQGVTTFEVRRTDDVVPVKHAADVVCVNEIPWVRRTEGATGSMSRQSSASIREALDHPIIDADAHAVEATPVLLEYLADVAGAAMVDRYRRAPVKRQFLLDPADPYWTKDSGSWVWPTRNTLDRATATLPSLYAQRLDEFGIDFVLVYPSEGLFANQLADDELRVACCRAYNCYIADAYRPVADRMTPAAVIPMNNPGEAIAELEYAVRTSVSRSSCCEATSRRPTRGWATVHPASICWPSKAITTTTRCGRSASSSAWPPPFTAAPSTAAGRSCRTTSTTTSACSAPAAKPSAKPCSWAA